MNNRNFIVPMSLAVGAVMTLYFGDNSEEGRIVAEVAYVTPVTSASAFANSDQSGATSLKSPEASLDARQTVGRDAEIVLPNDRIVRVHLRQYSRDTPNVPKSHRLVDHYDAWVYAAAGGDVGSASSLYTSLRYCGTAYRDKPALAKAIRRLHRDSVLEYPNDVRPPEHVPRGIDITEFEQQLTHAYEYCEGITEEQLDQAEPWAQAAANMGDLVGINGWARYIDNTPKELRLWKDAWEAGYQTAAQRLAIIYRDGVPTRTGIGDPDYLKAYAYQLVAFKVNEAAYVGSDAGMLNAMDNALAGIGGFLNPQEQSAAENLAYEILSRNANCCIVGLLTPGE